MTAYRCTAHFEEAVLEMARSPKILQERIVDAMCHLATCNMPGSLPPDVMTEFELLLEFERAHLSVVMAMDTKITKPLRDAKVIDGLTSWSGR